MDHTRLKSKCQQGLVPSGGFRGVVPCLFQLLEAVCIPGLRVASFQTLPLSSQLCLSLWHSCLPLKRTPVSSSGPPGYSKLTSPTQAPERNYICKVPSATQGNIFTGSGDQNENILGGHNLAYHRGGSPYSLSLHFPRQFPLSHQLFLSPRPLLPAPLDLLHVPVT